MRWISTIVALFVALLLVPGVATAATPGSMRLVISGSEFGLAKGQTKTVSMAAPAGVTASCFLGGEYPYIIETEGLSRRMNFTANLRCDGVVGRVELTVGLQQAVPGGGYVNDKYNGPYANPTPQIILGVNSDPKPCFEISLGNWRGVAHPRLITDVVIYDFGWYPTYDRSLVC